jgi:hypothetical protein
MIIVEGPDGAGKSTLIGRIEKDWNLTREPRAVSKDAKSLVPIDDYIEQELRKGFGMRLYDRFALISSPQYMALPNRTFAGRMTDPDWLRDRHHRFAQIDPVIILCLPSWETVKKNTAVDVHDGLDLTNYIETIYLNYVNWYATYAHSSTSVMIWDYQKPDLLRLAALLRWADERCNGEERRSKKWKTSSD